MDTSRVDGFSDWRKALATAVAQAQTHADDLVTHTLGENPLNSGRGPDLLDDAMRIIALLEDAGLDIGRDSEGRVYIKNALGN